MGSRNVSLGGISPQMFTTSRLVAVLCSLLVGFSSLVHARHTSRQQLRQRQIEAAERFELRRRTSLEKSAPGVKNITFANPKASRRYSHCTPDGTPDAVSVRILRRWNNHP